MRYVGDKMDRGIWKVCPTCKKEFYIVNPDLWAFKMWAAVKRNGRVLLYFDKYSCKKKYEEGYRDDVTKRRSDALAKLHEAKRKKKGESPKKNVGEHYCYECAHSVKNMFGHYECLLNPNANMKNRACNRFRKRDEVENEK